MKAKKILIAVAIIVLIIFLGLIPFNNKQQIVIKASLYDVAKQINDLNNWKKWNINFINKNIHVSGSFADDQSVTIAPDSLYTLHHINPLTISLARKGNNSTSSVIEILPVTDSTTNILWNENITLFKLLTGSNSRNVSLNNLKKLLEDINYKYGFLIRIVPVKDTLILTLESNTSNTYSINIVAELYHSLQLFIQENHLPAEKKYFYKTQLINGKIAIGIPVYKHINNRDDIKFLQLPSNGRLIEGTYSGKLGGKQIIYSAITNFMMDKHLKQVAQPLEQYNVGDTDLQPNSNVNIKIYYPIF